MKRRYSLKSRKLFRDVFAGGKKYHLGSITIYIKKVQITGKTENSRFGIVTSKKIGKAFYRNFIKRRIRSICSELLASFSTDYYIIIKPSSNISKINFETMRVSIKNIFKQAGIIT